MLALIAQWWSLISISIRAHHECPRYQNDERALCLPRLLPNLLTADETAAIIEATETAARERNYTSSRHAHYATTDLPVAAVYADGGPRAEAARRVVDRALNATVAELIERCGASDPALHDGFVIKYTPTQQAGLRQHGDGGRYSATVALSRPQRTGVRVPRYAKLEPQTCALRKRFANETCNSNFPERTFAQERFSAQYPLLQYDEFCPRNCLGQSCDDVDEHLREKCVCSQACESVAASQVNDEYDFAGDGTRFSSLRDVVFSPERGCRPRRAPESRRRERNTRRPIRAGVLLRRAAVPGGRKGRRDRCVIYVAGHRVGVGAVVGVDRLFRRLRRRKAQGENNVKLVSKPSWLEV